MGKENIIELNGKRYDALSGKIMTAKPAKKVAAKTFANSVTSKNMDGFTKRRTVSPGVPLQQNRQVQKSHTLMRKTVSKPAAIPKVHAVTNSVHHKHSSDQAAMPILKTKNSVGNSLIRKFSPSHTQTHAQPATAELVTGVKVALAAAKPQASRLDIIQKALHDAASQHPAKLKRPARHSKLANKLRMSPRVLGGSSAVLAIVLLAGFFAFQNVPNLKMRVAANRAGLNGNLPSYQPPGFRLGNISYKTGEINVSYVSNSDQRNFKLSQVASSWNSNTLRDKLRSGSLGANNPMEVPSKGKTLFIYDDSSVTWVDGGILYKIDGQSKLTGEQLVHIASSL